MAMLPYRLCKGQGCNNITRQGYCDQCLFTYNDNKKKKKNLYATKRWKELRLLQLAEKPLCYKCEKKGLLVSATICDHIQDHKGNEHLFFDRNNHQSLCASCHNQKTMIENGALIKADRHF